MAREWADTLADWSDVLFTAALRRFRQKNPWKPTEAHLVREAEAIREEEAERMRSQIKALPMDEDCFRPMTPDEQARLQANTARLAAIFNVTG